jgi:hypothetical protein
MFEKASIAALLLLGEFIGIDKRKAAEYPMQESN